MNKHGEELKKLRRDQTFYICDQCNNPQSINNSQREQEDIIELGYYLCLCTLYFFCIIIYIYDK